MKRDMDLIRAILLKVEESDEVLPFPFEVPEYDERLVNDHIVLLDEAGLLEAYYSEMGSGAQLVVVVRKLTWEGHEFLDAARNEGIWSEAKEVAKKKGVDLPFKILQSLLEALLKAAVMSGI